MFLTPLLQTYIGLVDWTRQYVTCPFRLRPVSVCDYNLRHAATPWNYQSYGECSTVDRPCFNESFTLLYLKLQLLPRKTDVLT